jgi:hypothetical protein
MFDWPQRIKTLRGLASTGLANAMAAMERRIVSLMRCGFMDLICSEMEWREE